VTSERRPRSVRRTFAGIPRGRRRADDSGCPEVAEEGNAVIMRHKAYALDAGTRDRACASEDASFARSFDLCTSILTIHRVAQASWWWGGRKSITVGQARVTENNLHWGFHERTERSSPRVTLDASRGRGTSRKGRRSRSPSLRGSRARVWLPARRCAVAEVGRRRLASNKLGYALQKERSVSSERGSSSERRSAGETVGRRVERKVQSRVGLTAQTGEDRRKTQGDERSSFSGLRIVKNGELVVGPGL